MLYPAELQTLNSSEERKTGLEPATTCLEGRYSTIELHPRLVLFPASGPPLEAAILLISLLLSCASDRRFDSMEWVEQDSNLRRHCHQIYSLAPLAAWVSTRIGSDERPRDRRISAFLP